jgi:hypothetical protein
MPRHKKEQTLSQYIYDTSLTFARDADNIDSAMNLLNKLLIISKL